MQACYASDKFRIGDPQAGDMLGKSSLYRFMQQRSGGFRVPL
jgi:hypothetical protein